MTDSGLWLHGMVKLFYPTALYQGTPRYRQRFSVPPPHGWFVEWTRRKRSIHGGGGSFIPKYFIRQAKLADLPEFYWWADQSSPGSHFSKRAEFNSLLTGKKKLRPIIGNEKKPREITSGQ